MLPDKSVVYDSYGAPRINLSRKDGVFTAVIDVEGLAPYRTETAEERKVGISSLVPPTIKTKNLLELISSGSLAVQASAFATPGVGFEIDANGTPGRTLIGPGDLAMMHFRTARALRAALRLIDEDI